MLPTILQLHRTADLQQRIIWPKTSVIPRLRSPAKYNILLLSTLIIFFSTREGTLSCFCIPKSFFYFYFLSSLENLHSQETPIAVFFFFNIFIFCFLTLQYCIGFAIYQNESTTCIHAFPILNPPPSSLTVPSLWVVPVHRPQASSIVHRIWTGDSFHI